MLKNPASVFAIVFFAFVFSLFGLLGGLIGSALFGRKGKVPAGISPGLAIPPVPPPMGQSDPGESGELPMDELPPLPPRDDESGS